MKTFPLRRADGAQFAFEIGNTFISLSQISKIIGSVESVKDIQRVRGSDDRISFTFAGEPFVVHEPWGDNSRYWVGPVEPGNSVVDISPLHEAFLRHQSLLAQLLQGVRNAVHG